MINGINIINNGNNMDYIIIFTALAVLWSTNPVISIILLICLFISIASSLFISGVQFLALILLIVYIGAIAVLFLFIAMMLEVGDEFSHFEYITEFKDYSNYLIQVITLTFILILFFIPLINLLTFKRFTIAHLR